MRDCSIAPGNWGSKPTASFASNEIRGQAEQAWRNVGAVLQSAGMGFENIVKLTHYLTRYEDLAAYREVRAQFLGKLAPASTPLVINLGAGAAGSSARGRGDRRARIAAIIAMRCYRRRRAIALRVAPIGWYREWSPHRLRHLDAVVIETMSNARLRRACDDDARGRG